MRFKEGYVPCERDVIDILKSGRAGLENAKRRCIRHGSNIRYDELIENTMLTIPPSDRIYSGRGTIHYDIVADSIDRAKMELKQADDYEDAMRRSAVFSYIITSSIWDAMDELDPLRQGILRDYYIEKMTPGEVAEKYGCSEATFWRRRREAVSYLTEAAREVVHSCAGRDEITEVNIYESQSRACP